MSPLAPLGVEAALKAKEDPSFVPRPKIFDEFALTDRVGLVSGGNRGIGLETAIALAEAGARACVLSHYPQSCSCLPGPSLSTESPGKDAGMLETT